MGLSIVPGLTCLAGQPRIGCLPCISKHGLCFNHLFLQIFGLESVQVTSGQQPGKPIFMPGGCQLASPGCKANHWKKVCGMLEVKVGQVGHEFLPQQ